MGKIIGKYKVVEGRECDKCIFDLFEYVSSCISMIGKSNLPDCVLEDCHFELAKTNECGQCGNTVQDDGEIFCAEIQSRVDNNDEACESFSNRDPQYR